MKTTDRLKEHTGKAQIPERKPDLADVLRKSISEVAKTKDGQTLLSYIMNQCGWLRNSVCVDNSTQEINPIATIHEEARRSLWLRLRQFIPREQLILIELGPEKEDKELPNETSTQA